MLRAKVIGVALLCRKEPVLELVMVVATGPRCVPGLEIAWAKARDWCWRWKGYHRWNRGRERRRQ